ncbi:amidase [Anaeromyxobacter oryzae]|uniref:6-aminohexanoate-cyclic-dimer hydrolase n=1 Tax=Anaeromyxobacter oryzae TaxID=2918170 RepID=A0ABM7WPG6_9BACT|nr:amidase family protein [Anaeromyxobacter oryzae]BDG01362.1 6-aminohexanoate-cyclic-dimer hydrolase [Anaeromyxobacter oryzae]
MDTPSPARPAASPPDPFAELDATAQAELVRTRRATPLELVDAAIARIERVGPALNALAAIDPDRARAAARGPLREGPFAGVPFLAKDLLAVPGLPYGAGSRLLHGQPAPGGSAYAQALEDAGLIVVGKTTTSEFGLLGTTETLACGATRNPWDVARSPAGSSGGSAAAVAAGLVPMAHASDGGGSIRIPASACGLFGLKPSRGRERDAGLPAGAPLAMMVNDHCVSRTVRDSAALLLATQRVDAAAPLPPLAARDLAPAARPRRLRIAVYDRTAFGLVPHPEVSAGLAAARALCERLGHETVDSAGPRFDARAVSDAFFLLAGATVAPLVAQVRQAAGVAALPSLLEPFTLELAERAERAPPGAVPAAIGALVQAGAAMTAFIAGFDATLCPTIPILPFELGVLSPARPADACIAFTEVLAGYTPIHSIAGVPAMSVPLHWTAGGLPVGCHFAAGVGREALLLELAYALEEAAPWRHRRPPVSALPKPPEGPWRSA